jgi:outer membrane protein OmpU
MKKILLASVALTAFAGAAAAEVSFSGSATLGYNDDNGRLAGGAVFGDHQGFYSDLNLDVAFSAELDNGLTVSASADVDEVDAEDNASRGVTVTLSSANASLVYGDTEFAAKSMWSAAGDMEADSFSIQDGEGVLKGTLSFGGVDLAVSGVAYNDQGTAAADDLAQMSVGAKATVGAATVVVAYQEEVVATDFATASTNGDFYNAETLGISVAMSVAGADVKLAYASEKTTGGTDYDSTGIAVSYPMGDVTVSAYFVAEDDSTAVDAKDNYGVKFAYAAGAVAGTLGFASEQGTDYVSLEGSYDLGNGLNIYAGAITKDGDTDDTYVGASYDLGGGASLLVSYADDTNNDEAAGDDDIGAQGYAVGTTVELSFAF